MGVYDYPVMSEEQQTDPVIPATVDDEPPPFLGTWNRVYASVLIYVIVVVLLLYWMTVSLND